MRNLKKILALVLALVMSFSLMATANAFTDSEKITDTYETAVTVLDGLKVFQGYDDGSFQPQGSITRAEVATIIYRIVTGDVEGKQVGIYADYNKFDDVKSTSWYAGYVNFCANAEYIKGRDAKTFDPNAYVTGYEALAMILRAIGYDKNGEFTGSNWQIQTAATGELRGITKNITEGTLGAYASREVVAEILFQTILVDTVNYTPAFGYQLNDTSLGWDTFKLEEITGVVVANEYADLYDTDTLKAGRTELDVDGDSYIIDYTTTLEDIGEARDAYVTEGKNVLYIADAGNTVFETGAETDIKTDSKFEKATGLERGDAEEFVNFDGGNEYKASDWKIKYVVEIEKAGLTAEEDAAIKDFFGTKNIEDANGVYTCTKTINPGKTITDTDLSFLKAIFYGADKDGADADDYIYGEIYVGTQSTTDISDDPDMSWKIFQNKYIETDENAIEVEGNENGEWLKVIDNDGDGEADYVLLTKYVMAAVTDINKDGDYTVSVDVSGDLVEIDSADMMTEDELAEDDIIVYAYIDGNYIANIADMVTETIDKKGIDYKAETITCGENTYGQSGIYVDEDEFQDAFLYDHFLFDVTDADTEVAYDLYLDNFGFVRALTENKYAYGLGLLTDGYYETNGKVETIQVDMNTVDTEETTYDVDADSDWDLFIDADEDGDNGNRGTWGRLEGFQGNYANAHQFATNVAAFSNSDDVLSLYDVDEYTNKELDTLQNELVLTAKSDLDDKELTAYFNDKATEQHTVYATADTVYYYVNFDKDGDPYVEATWTGYNNAPKGLSLDAAEDYAYAVYTQTKADSDYYYADVIVIEAESELDDVYFLYYANTKDTNKASYWVKTVGYDAEEEGYVADYRIDTEKDDANRVVKAPAFYVIDKDGVVELRITENFASHGIYADTATVARDVSSRDYVYTYDYDLSYKPADVNVYALDKDEDSNLWVAYSIDVTDTDVNDELILFTDGDDVEYVINVTASDEADLDALYDAIMADQASVNAPVLTVNETLDHAAASVAYDAPNVVGGVTVDWTATVTLKADTGYELDATALTAVLAVTGNGIAAAPVQVGDDVTITVTGLTKDNVLVVTGADASAKIYGITYKVAGESFDYTGIYTYGTAEPLMAAPAKPGYEFDGWYDNADYTGDKVTAIAAGETGNKIFYGRYVEDVVTLTVEYRDVNGNLLNGGYTKTYLKDATDKLAVEDPAKYSVDGDPQGYVLNGVIDITMDADTTIVVTYVDTYDVKLVVNDDEDQWGDTWTFRIADHDDTNSITKVAANATQVDLKGTHESATGALGYNRTLDYTFGTSAEQHIVTTGTFTIPLTLTGKLTSEGYVITINSIGA